MSTPRLLAVWFIGIAGAGLSLFFLFKQCLITAWYIGAAALAALDLITSRIDD